MDEGFLATCSSCGAPQPLLPCGGIVPCVHCGAPDPLDPATRQRVRAVAATLGKLVAREQHLVGEQLDAVSSVAWMIPLFALGTWGVFGGIALSIAHSEKPEHVGLFELLSVDATKSGTVMAWWIVFLFVAGVLATVSSYFVLVHRMRARVRVPPALPPIAAGAPCRCRHCGAGLRGSGVRQACVACGAANLIDRHVPAMAAALSDHLAKEEAALLGESAVLHRVGDRLAYATAAYPIVLVLALPLGLAVPETRPDLLWILVALAAPAVLFAPLVALQKLPPDPFMGKLRVGGRVLVRGVPLTVHAKLDASSLDLPTRVGVLFVLGEREPSLAAFAFPGTAAAYTIHPGGSAFAGEQLSTVTIEDARGSRTGSAPRGAQPIRVFDDAQPPLGAAPRWTLVEVELEPDDFVVAL